MLVSSKKVARLFGVVNKAGCDMASMMHSLYDSGSWGNIELPPWGTRTLSAANRNHSSTRALRALALVHVHSVVHDGITHEDHVKLLRRRAISLFPSFDGFASPGVSPGTALKRMDRALARPAVYYTRIQQYGSALNLIAALRSKESIPTRSPDWAIQSPVC